MISGTDIIIPVRNETDALDFAVRAVVRLWGCGVVLEDGCSGEVFSGDGAINLFGRCEILAFRDAEAARRWNELGVHPSLDGTLIHLLVAPGQLTVSIDASPSPQIRSFVQSLRAALRKDLFASVAEIAVAVT